MSISSVGSIGSTSSYGFIDRMVMNTMNRSSKTQKDKSDLSQVTTDIFKNLDANGDGNITKDELLAGLQNIQSSQSSQTKPPQGPPPMGPPPDASQMASKIMQDEDSNGDAVLSASETGLSSDDYNILDVNGDGKVTTDELVAGLKARESERAAEMAAMSQESASAASSTSNSLQTLLDILTQNNQNNASNAYGDQSWLYQILQSSAQNLSVTT